MKRLIIIVLMFTTCFLFGQKRDVKVEGENQNITFNGTYIVEQDTSGSGVITITLTPTIELLKDLESQLGSLNSEQSNNDIKIVELQERNKQIKREVKEIEKLILKINKVKVEKDSPIVPNPTPNKVKTKKQ